MAARLRKAGATVLTPARTWPDNLADADLFVSADVTTVDGCASVAEKVLARLGGIDIIVHVFGGSSAPARSFAILDDRERDRAFAIGQIAVWPDLVPHDNLVLRVPVPDVEIPLARQEKSRWSQRGRG